MEEKLGRTFDVKGRWTASTVSMHFDLVVARLVECGAWRNSTKSGGGMRINERRTPNIELRTPNTEWKRNLGGPST
jgi:hypothetical protein